MTSCLDIHASRVSPPPSETETQTLNKHRRHRMRRTAGRILKQERVAKCGRAAIGQAVTVHAADTGHHFGSVETCGSVWTCPVCAAKITEHRRVEIDAVLQAHHAAGGVAYMMTLTIPHVRLDSCSSLLETVRNVWRWVKTGAPWQRAKAKAGYMGDVRALEVTHGQNGWHPHLHILVFLAPGTTDEAAEELGFWFFKRWSRGVEKRGHPPCSPDAFTFREVDEAEGAAAYLGKWGAAMELTKAHTKRSKSGGRTPWQLLDDCRRGNRRDVALFSQYARAFKGARQLTWAGNIRDRYCEEPELSDQEAATPPALPETQNATIHRPLFKEINRKNLQSHVLVAADQGGISAVADLLKERGIAVKILSGRSLDPNKSVPWLCLDAPDGNGWDITKSLEKTKEIQFPGNPAEGVSSRWKSPERPCALLAHLKLLSRESCTNPASQKRSPPPNQEMEIQND